VGKTKGLDHLRGTHSQLRLAAVTGEDGGTSGIMRGERWE
jgi:hypothetical protein